MTDRLRRALALVPAGTRSDSGASAADVREYLEQGDVITVHEGPLMTATKTTEWPDRSTRRAGRAAARGWPRRP